MKLHATLRRTLALLLVLIFAMSNIGLAEVAEQLVEDVPDVEPSIEEPVVEEIAPEEEADADGDVADVPEGEEPAAPAEPAQDSEVEPEEVAVSVAVEVSQIDETSLCAYETIEPEDAYEVSYVWERAAGEDGEWETLAADGDVYSTDAEDRFDYVYRCTAIVNGVSATSAPVAFAQAAAEEPADEAHALIDLGEDFGLAELNDASAVELTTSDDPFIVYNKDAAAGSADKVVLTDGSSTNGSNATITYTWSVQDTSQKSYVSIETSGEKNETATIKATAEGAALASSEKGLDVVILCSAKDSSAPDSAAQQATKTVTILPAITEKQVEEAIAFATSGDPQKTYATEFAQGSDVYPVLKGLSEGYEVTWSVLSEGANPAIAGDDLDAWVTTTSLASDKHFKINEYTSGNNKFTSPAGQTIPVQAVVANGGKSITKTKSLTVYPAAESLKIKIDGKDMPAQDNAAVRAVYDVIKISGEFVPKTGSYDAEKADGIKCIASMASVKAAGSKGGSVDLTKSGENTFTFIPTVADTYTLTVTQSPAPGVATSPTPLQITVKELPKDVKIDDESANGVTTLEKSFFLTDDLATDGELKLKITDAGDLDLSDIKWTISGNKIGTSVGAPDLLTFEDGDSHAVTFPAEGLDKLVITQINQTLQTNQTVTLTVTGRRMPDATKGDTEPQDIVALTFVINILTGTDVVPTDSDLTVTPVIIGQPAQDYTGDAPAYATAQASVSSKLQNCKIEWALDETKGQKFADIDSTGKITVKDKGAADTADQNKFATTDGQEIEVIAKVTTQKDQPQKEIKQKIKIRPVPDDISFSATGIDTQKNGGKFDLIANNSLTQFEVKLNPSAKNVTGNPALFTHTLSTTLTLKGEKDTPDRQIATPTVNNDGKVSIDVHEPGTYLLSATAKVDGETTVISDLTINVYAAPESLDVKMSPETATVYPGSEITFTVEAKDADGKPYDQIGTPEWTLSAVGLDASTDYSGNMLNGSSAGAKKAGLYDTDLTGGKTVTLVIPDKYPPDGSDAARTMPENASFNVNVSFPGTGLSSKSFTLNLKAKPTVNFSTGNYGTLKINGYYKYETAGALASDGLTKYIPQGDTSASAKFEVSNDATNKKNFEDATKGYTLKYSLVCDDKDDAYIAKYVNIDPDTGAITVLPEVKTGDAANELKSSSSETTNGIAFKVRYGIEGFQNTNTDYAEADFVILPAPKGVDIVAVKADTKKPETALNIPRSIMTNGSTDVTAVLVPQDNCNTAGKIPTLSAAPTNSAYTFKQEETDGQTNEYFTLKSVRQYTGNLKVTISASYTLNGKELTDTHDIVISNDTYNLAAWDDTTTCGTSGSKAHEWELVTDTEEIKTFLSGDAKSKGWTLASGHFFKCKAGDCNKYSKPVAHTGFTPVLSEDEKKAGKTPEDVLWKGAHVGHLRCQVCGWECDHSTYPTTGATYVDGSHHIAQCPICLQQVKEAHYDKNGDKMCDACGRSVSNPTFSEQDKILVVGDKYIPSLTVEDADFWTVQYALDTGSDQFLKLLNADTGEVQAEHATGEGQKAVLIATITPHTGEKSDEIIGKLNIVVKEKIDEISISSDIHSEGVGKAYVVDSGDGAAKNIVIHLTATISPDSAIADLQDYEWQIDPAVSGQLEFVVKNKTTDAWEELGASSLTADEKAAAKSALEIDIRAQANASGNNGKPVSVFFKNTKAVYAEDYAEGEIKIDVLPKLEATGLEKMITFNDTEIDESNYSNNDRAVGTGFKVIQGQTLPVSLVAEWKNTEPASDRKTPVAFDTRYGKVAFSVEALDAATEIGSGKALGENGSIVVAANNRSQWLNIVNAGETSATISAKGPSDYNKLTTAPNAAAFHIRATVTHEWTTTDTTGKEVPDTTFADRYVWVIGDNTTAKFQYKKGATWTDVPAAGLDVDEGDAVDIRLSVSTTNGPGIAATAITWGEVAKTDGEFATTETKTNAEWERKFTVAQRGAQDTITISASYPGMSIAPMKLNVKRLMHSLTLNCDVTEIGAGEMDKDGSLSSYKSFIVTAQPDNPDTGDTLTWSLVAKDGSTAITDVKLEDVEGNKYQKKIDLSKLTGNKRGMALKNIGPEVVVKVTAGKSKDADQQLLTATHTIKIYQTPTSPETPDAAADTLAIETVKKLGPTADGTGTELWLTKGENTEISYAGWTKDSIYGASDAVTMSEFATANHQPTAEEDEGKDVISVSGNVIKGEVIGTADVTFHPVNYSTAVDAIEKKLTVHVTEAANLIEIASDAKFETEYTIGVGEPEADRKTIDKAWFKVYRETTNPVSKTEAKDAAVTLISDNPEVLEIVESKDKTKWELKGIAPGAAYIYGYVNDTTTTEASKIKVNVEAAPEGIVLKRNGTAVGAQLVTNMETPETFVLTAETIPAAATGKIEITVDSDTVVTSSLDEAGTTVTLTPKAAGKAIVTAKTPNTKWVGPNDTLQDPQYLTARVEILVTATAEGGGEDQPGPGPGVTTPATIDVVGKQAIGPKETTQLAATGIETGKTVVWTAEPADAADLKSNPSDNSVEITPKTTGTVTVTGSVDGASIGSKTIYLLTAPEKVAFSRGEKLTMTLGETLELGAIVTEGYDFADAAAAQAAGVEKDESDLFTFTSSNAKCLSVTNDHGKFIAKALKQTSKKTTATLTITAKGGATATVPVEIAAKNKSFKIGAYNGSTLYMAPGEKKTIPVTTSPKNSPVNLIWEISDGEGTYVDAIDGELSVKGGNIEIDAGATTVASYKVTVKAEGYTDHAEQSFTIVVQDAATQSDTLAIAVRKVGANGTGYGEDDATDSVTVVKGEQLQAYFVDNGTPVAGAISWTAQTKAEKKKAELNTTTGLIKVKGTSGSVTINGTVNGIAAKPITLTLAKAPKATLDPNVKTRTVAKGEEFQLGMALSTAYPDAKANEFYSISWTDFEPEPASSADMPTLWKFDQAGVTTATLKPLWGGTAQKVKFTVLDTEVAESFNVPEEVFVAAGAKTIVRAEMDGYVNLTWLNGTDPITTKDKATVADKKIKVKTLANDEVQITAAKGAVGAEISVKTLGDAEPQKIKITVKPADTQFPADTMLVFDKPVITVGESTIVGLDFGAEDAPVGNITYSFKSVKGAGKVSIKNNVVTGKTPGVATVVAKLGSGKNAATKTGTIYVLPKARIQTTLNPTKMGANETLTMGVTITDYVTANVPDENLKDQVNTVGMLTVESSSNSIAASLEAVEDTTNQYELTLKAGEAQKTSKGKYTTTTITLRLSNGQKKTMKIQVVEPADADAVYTRSTITMAPKTTVKLNAAIAEGAAYAANFDWHFIDEDSAALAAKHELTLADGKLSTTKNSSATTADEEIIVEGTYGEKTEEIKVVIAGKKAGKNQFKLAKPNRSTVYLGEKFMADIAYDAGVGGGDITWKTSSKKVISVDKTTGLYTAIGPAGKSSTISATVNGKSSKNAKAKLTVVAAPSSVSFNVADIVLPVGATNENILTHVRLDGSALAAGADYTSVLSFDVSSNAVAIDPETGAITTSTEGSAIVTVTTYNGLTARMLIVVGQGSGSVGPGPDVPPVDPTTAKTIELYLNNKTLNDQTVTLTEGGEGLTPEIVVKSADGKVIANAAVSWTSSDSEKVSVDAATGAIKPLLHTKDSATNAHVPVVITASVTGTDATPATYKVEVNPDPKKATNFKFEMKNKATRETLESLLVGDGKSTNTALPNVTGSVVITVPNTPFNTVVVPSSVKVTSQPETVLKITSDARNTDNLFKVEALKAGEAKVSVEMTLIGGEKVSFEQTVTVNDLPAKDSMKLVDADGNQITSMKLGDEEVGEFFIQIDGFNGKLSKDDVTFKVTTLEDESTDYSADYFTIEDDDKDLSKRTIASKADTQGKYKVLVKAFEDRITGTAEKANAPQATFDLQIVTELGRTDFKYSGTPELSPTGESHLHEASYSLTLGNGESVTLKAEKIARCQNFWSKGVEWVDATEYEDTDVKATVTKAEGENAVTVSLNDPELTETNSRTITMKLQLVDGQKASPTEFTTVTITFWPLPSKNAAGEKNYSSIFKGEDGNPLASSIKIGVNEKFTVTAEFDAKAATPGYATNLRWVADENYVTMEQNGLSCTFTGKASTTDKMLDVHAYYGSGTALEIGTSFKIKVVDAPEFKDLQLLTKDDQGKFTATFANKLHTANNKDVNTAIPLAVVLDEGVSADLSLTCANNCIVAQPVTGEKNQWNLWYTTGLNPVTQKTPSAIESAARSVTLVLSDPANKLYKNINLKLDSSGTIALDESGTTSVKSVEVPDPKATHPNGIPKDEDETGCTAEELEQNQSAVTVSVADNNTIVLGADTNNMAGWTSTEGTKGTTPGVNDDDYKWFCLVIDTGIKVDSGIYKQMNYQGPGDSDFAKGDSSFSAMTSDEKAWKDWGATNTCITLWLQLDYWAGYKIKYQLSDNSGGSNPKTFIVDLTNVVV